MSLFPKTTKHEKKSGARWFIYGLILTSYYKTRGTDPQTTYGGRAYATYDIYDGFYAIGGIQAESYKRYNEEGRIWQISIPVGAGYRRCFGNLCVYAEVTYDLLFDEDSYGENPMIRAGAN